MEITRTPNTNGTVDTCTLEDGYGFQCETHTFVRRGVSFVVVIGEHEEGAFGTVDAHVPAADGPELLARDRFEALDRRYVKEAARGFVEEILFPELNTRPRYGTPEWEANELALETRELEDEYFGR